MAAAGQAALRPAVVRREALLRPVVAPVAVDLAAVGAADDSSPLKNECATACLQAVSARLHQRVDSTDRPYGHKNTKKRRPDPSWVRPPLMLRPGLSSLTRREATQNSPIHASALAGAAGSHAGSQAGSQPGSQHDLRHGLQRGTGQHTFTGTCLHTTRGTHRVTVYGTFFGTIRTQFTVFS